MMDVGKNIRRSNKSTQALAEKIQKSDFMNGWLIDNEQNFKETMELIREGAPVKWAELYMRAYGLGLAKESNINININRQKDRDDLQALVRSRISLPDTGTYTPYEEIKQPIRVEKEEE